MRGAVLMLCLTVVPGCATPGPAVSEPPTVGVPASSAGADGGEPPGVKPAASGAHEVMVMRRALVDDGAGLADEEVVFLHDALRRSGTDYTTDGLNTFVEWELRAQVTKEAQRYMLFVAGARVNAEWELFVDKATGTVTVGTVATEAPP